MFFCPNCNNSFDITRITSLKQKGGAGKNIKNSDITDSSIGFLDSTESQELSQTDSVVSGGDAVADLIKAILDNKIDQHFNSMLKNISTSDVTKHIEFKKLNTKQKELVFNKIQDNLPKEKKKIIETKTVQKDESSALFICTNCGYTDKIEPQTLIFSRSADSISQNYTVSNYKNMIYSDILPRTRKYICKNSKCPSQNDPTKREAVMFRLNNTYNVKYVCTTCYTEI